LSKVLTKIGYHAMMYSR